jgi:predicted nucleotidyltransferase
MTRDMRQLDYAELRAIISDQPYRLLFATVSGAHLYGFPSRDSDVDLRGVHLLPVEEVVGLTTGPDTLDRTWFQNEAEVDLLIALAPGCLTRWHAHHYRGFANTQWNFFVKKGELKPLLYTFRVLLTGIHLLRTGEVQADLRSLVELAEAPAYLPELMVAKAEAEHAPLVGPSSDELEQDVTTLHATLDQAEADSKLAERPTADAALHDLVVRARLRTV